MFPIAHAIRLKNPRRMKKEMRASRQEAQENMTHRRCGALPQDIPHFRSFLSHVRLLSDSPQRQASIPNELSDICPCFQPTFADICHATRCSSPPDTHELNACECYKKGEGGDWMHGSHIYKYITDFFCFLLMARILKHPFLFFKCWISREVT